MSRILAALLPALSLTLSTGARAEEWPTRPLTMINPFAAGGPNDVLARLFAQRMGEILGQPIIIENVGGAGGVNGADGGGERRRPGRESGPRRLHIPARDGRNPGPEPDAVQEAGLQFDDRFCAGGADRRTAIGADAAQ